MSMEHPEWVVEPGWAREGKRVKKPYAKRVPEGSMRRNKIIYALAEEKSRLIHEAAKTLSPDWAWNYEPKK